MLTVTDTLSPNTKNRTKKQTSFGALFILIMNISTVHFDISPDGRVCNGTLTLTDGILTKNLDGKEEKFNINDFCEAVQLTDIGCGKLELKPQNTASDGSENVTVCRFSMSCVGEIGELVKAAKELCADVEFSALDATICMGASISGLHGFNKANEGASDGKSVAVIGDSTFMHSGITGLVDIVYNKGNNKTFYQNKQLSLITQH